MHRRSIAALSLVAAMGMVSGADAARNFRPVFVSASTATAPENATGVVYVARATDRNNDPLTYSILPERDGALFSIDPAGGGVRFRVPPDFEAPSDNGRDNVYRLRVAASDGRGGMARQAVQISVTDLDERIRVRRRGAGFSFPVFLTGAGDGSGRVFVIEKGGLIRILNPATGAINAAPFLDVSGLIATDGERGLLGLAFAPDYASSGLFYIQISTLAGPTEIRRYHVSLNPDIADSTSGDAIYSFAHPRAFHRAGWIGFGADGLLHIASGDAALGVSPANPGQDPNSPLGKLLRIDVSGDDFPADPARDYKIPPGNPYATGGGLPEIFAIGLRNPFRASVDPLSGALLVGDVGESMREEIDLVARGDAGRNFGWVRFEGTFVLVPEAAAPNATPPVIEYVHGAGPFEGNSVTGGVVNRGPVPGLQNQYIFGDFISRNIWSVPLHALVQGTTLNSAALTRQTDAFLPDVGTIEQIVSFGTDDAGYVYVVDLRGDIFRMESN